MQKMTLLTVYLSCQAFVLEDKGTNTQLLVDCNRTAQSRQKIYVSQSMCKLLTSIYHNVVASEVNR